MHTLRYKELDILRGIAVLFMILFHAAFDLQYFYNWDIDVHNLGWEVLRICTVSIFLLLIGICCTISSYRNPTHAHAWKYAKRGGIIFAGGMIISLATWFFDKQAFVKFGILHLIGISSILQIPFVRAHSWNVLLGSAWMLIAFLLPSATSSYLLFPFGIPYPTFSSLDYYPLIPWFGVILIGMGLGSFFYTPKPQWQWTLSIPPLECIGRYALLIYFVHQPVLLAILATLHGVFSQG